jgi:hypothetical protein
VRYSLWGPGQSGISLNNLQNCHSRRKTSKIVAPSHVSLK